MPRTFYRIVKADPPGVSDFLSNAAKGFPPTEPEVRDPDIYHGISVQDSLDGIRAAQLRTRIRGNFAKLDIPEQAPVLVKKTLGAGHFTIKGDAQLLLSYVVLPLIKGQR